MSKVDFDPEVGLKIVLRRHHDIVHENSVKSRKIKAITPFKVIQGH